MTPLKYVKYQIVSTTTSTRLIAQLIHESIELFNVTY